MKQWLIVLLSFVLASWGTSAKSQVTVDVANRIGASSFDYANGLTVDAQGNIYVTGSFSGTNASFGLNVNGVNVTRTSSGSEDIFVAKYNSSGRVLWVQTAGAPGNNADRGQKIELDGMGNVYVVGFFSGTASFSPTESRLSKGDDDAFVAKYDANTGNLIWVAAFGGSQKDRANAIDTDNQGNIYVVGFFQGQLTLGNQTLTSRGENDIFIASWTGNADLRWAARSGSSSVDEGESIVWDRGDIYTTGRFSGTADFVNPGGQTFANVTASGLSDLFVTRRNAATGALVWVVRGGGIQSDYGYDIEADGLGHVVVVGRFSGVNAGFASTNQADVNLSSVVATTGPTEDAFVIKYTTDGNIVWAKTIGGTLIDYATGVDVDDFGRVTVSGQFQGSFDFDGNPNRRVTSNGNYDVFFAAYDANGNFVDVLTYGGNSDDRPTDHFAYNETGGSFRIAATGNFFNAIRFGNQPLLLSAGQSDGFVIGLTYGTPSACDLPTPLITAGSVVNCAQLLTATNFAGATSFEWRRDNLVIPGANQSTFNATQSGNYTVTISNNQPGCFRTSTSINVSVNNNISVSAGNNLSINAGQSATLTATVTGAPVGNVAFTWTNAATGQVVGNTAQIVVTPSITTTYLVSARDNVSGCTATSTVTVNVIGGACLTPAEVLVSIIPGNDNVPATTQVAEICIGQSSSFQAASFIGNTRYTYRWFRVDQVTGQNILASNLNLPILESQSIPGRYFLQITDNTGQCPQVNSGNEIILEVYPIPSVTASVTQTPGNPATLTAVATGGTPFNPPNLPQNGDVNGYRYSWQPADAIVGSSNSNVVTASPTIVTTFTVQIQDRIQCGARATVVAQAVVPQLSIQADGATTFCTGGSVNLIASLSNGDDPAKFTYVWTRNGVTIPGQSSFILNVTQSGNYQASIIGTPTRTSNIISVSVIAAPVANAGPDRVICSGESTTIGTSGVAGTSYSWSPSFGLSNPNAAVTTVSGLAPGTYIYTLTASVPNCPPNTSNVVVTVLDAPRPEIAASGPTVTCQTPVQLFVVNPVPGVNYTWQRGSLNVSGGTSTSFTATISGTYRVVASTSVGNRVCTTPSDAIDVRIAQPEALPIPKIQPFGSANINLCTGGTLNLFVADSYFDALNAEQFGAVDIRWIHYPQGMAGPMSIVGTGRRYTATMPGIYFAEAFTGDDCSTKKSEGLFVTRSEVTSGSLLVDDNWTICRESSVCLHAIYVPGSPGMSSISDVRIINRNTGLPAATETLDIDVNQNTISVCVKPVVTTTYAFEVTDSYGCTVTREVTVNIKSIEPPTISGPDRVCNNATATLQINNPDAYNAYRWLRRPLNASANTSWEIITPGSQWPNATTLITGTRNQYAVEAAVEGCDWERSNVISLDVVNAPSVPNITGGNRTVCEDNSGINMSATASANATGSLAWNWSGSFINAGFDSQSVTVQPVRTTVYTVTATNSNGCSSSSTTTITVVNRPVVGISGGSICSNASFVFTIGQAVPAGYSVAWQRSTNEASGFTNVAGPGNLPSFTTSTAGFYRALLISSVCSGEVFSNVSELTVGAAPSPVAVANARHRESPNTITSTTGITVCVGEPFSLFASSVSSNLTYEWYATQVGTQDRVFITSNPGTSANPNVIQSGIEFSTVYQLVTINPNTGCTASNSVTVTVSKEEGPVAYAEAERDIVCEGTIVKIQGFNRGRNAQVFASRSNRFYSYRWNGPTGTLKSGIIQYSFSQAQVDEALQLVTGPLYATTTFTLTLDDPNSFCVATCPVTIEVGQRLVATIQREGGENLCEGPVTLRAISNTGRNVLYQWYTSVDERMRELNDNSWTIIPGATGQTFTPTTGGRYTVRVIDPAYPACYDDADNWVTLTGVRSDARSSDLVVTRQFGLPVVQTMPAVICRNQSITLEARYIFGASYQWYRLDGPASAPQYTLLAGEFDRFLTVSAPGRYIVQVTAGCFSCPEVCEIWSQVCPVVVVPSIQPTVHHVGRVELCPNGVDEVNSVELYTQGDTRQYAYQWMRNGVAIDGATDVRYVATQTGTYTVRVTSRFDQTNGRNCFGMSTNSVTVVPCSSFVCPQPISVRAMLDPHNGTIATIMWDQPQNTSGNGTPANPLTGNYIVEYRAVGSANWTATNPVVTVNRTSVMVMGLTPNTQYEARVRTICTTPAPQDRSAWSMGMFRTPATSGDVVNNCRTPQLIVRATRVSNSSGEVDLSWTVSGGDPVNGYLVEVRRASNNQLAATVETPNTTTTVPGLEIGVGYIATVTARCTNGNSIPSNQVSFTITDGDLIACNDPLAEPVLSSIANTSAVISWTGAANVAPNGIIFTLALDVELNNPLAPFSRVYQESEVRDPQSEQQYNLLLNNLQPNTTYYYVLQVLCENGVAPTQFSGQFQTLSDGNPVQSQDCIPQAIYIESVSANEATIGWTPVQGAITYAVRLLSNQVVLEEIEVPGNQTSVSFISLDFDTEYTARVRANVDNPGCATDSRRDNEGFLRRSLGFRTSASIVPTFSSVSIVCQGVNQSATFLFTTVPGAIRYEYQYRDTDNPNADGWVTENEGTPFEINDPFANQFTAGPSIVTFTSGRIYEFRLRAVTDVGASDWAYAIVAALDCGVAPKSEVTSSAAKFEFSVYPNPNKGAFTVSFGTQVEGNATIRLMDLTGRTIITRDVTASAGQNAVEINAADDLASGLYLIQLQVNGQLQAAKLIVE